MKQWQREENQKFIDQIKSVLKEGGKWIWPATGYIYTLQNDQLIGDSKEADEALLEILPKK